MKIPIQQIRARQCKSPLRYNIAESKNYQIEDDLSNEPGTVENLLLPELIISSSKMASTPSTADGGARGSLGTETEEVAEPPVKLCRKCGRLKSTL